MLGNVFPKIQHQAIDVFVILGSQAQIVSWTLTNALTKTLAFMELARILMDRISKSNPISSITAFKHTI